MEKKFSIVFMMVLLSFPVLAAWDSPDMGNPLLPGYTADPTIMYDSATATFYIYSTSDGLWISYSGDPQVAYSKDFVNWKFKSIELPSFWSKTKLWAPTAMRHPVNRKYYLMYCIGDAVYIAYSDSPLGPWKNAVWGDNPLYRTGDLTGRSDWIDPQFFIDTNTVYFTFGQGGDMGIAKLSFNSSNNLVTIDGGDRRMTDGVRFKCKKLAGLSDNLEGSCMFKKGNRYFITYSNSACQNYNVRYAVASSPVGPFTYMNRAIVQRDNSQHILGPGHNSILHYGNNWYICYHRQHYQYVDVKRQTCIDQIAFDGDMISTGSQTNAGVWSGSGSLESLVAESIENRENDLAFGKTVIASSESAYKGGTSGNQREKFSSINGFYKARYAVDRNNGTRWAPATLPGYLIVDLGAEYPVTRCETTFEMVMRTYRYRIEYLKESDAANITEAKSSFAWKMYADRSANTQNVSPVVDSNSVSARYFKLALFSADLPTASAEVKTIIETDYADRVSVFEFKVFSDNQTGIINSTADYSRDIGIGSTSYEMSHEGSVEVTLIDPNGQIIRRYVETKQSEKWILNVERFDVPSGIYVIKIKSPGIQKIQKAIVGAKK